MRRPAVPVLCCLLVLSAVGAAQTAPGATPATTSLARELLRAMNAESTFVQGIELGLASAKKKDPSVPQVFYDSTLARMRRSAGDLIDSLVPIYASRFTESELGDLLAFYRSPVGLRYTALQLEVTQETGKVAQRWGMRVSMDTMKDLVEKGLVSPDE